MKLTTIITPALIALTLATGSVNPAYPDTPDQPSSETRLQLANAQSNDHARLEQRIPKPEKRYA